MKKLKSKLVTWIKERVVQNLFYNLLVDVIQDELEIQVILQIDGERYLKTKWKHVYPVGCKVMTLDEKMFLIEQITVSHFGSTIYVDGKLV